LAKRLQQFYILKLESGRLKESDYCIENLSINEARDNGELVSISDSQLVRTLYSITGRELSNLKLNDLLDEKRYLSKRKNSKEDRKMFKSIMDKIDEMLFIPDIISIQFVDKRHFQDIVDNGLEVNGINFVYFMSSAGQTRRDQSLFIRDSLKQKIQTIFNNDRNFDVPLIPQKFSAYYSLYSSSSQEITFPRLAVVKDVTITAKKTVDFSTYISTLDDPVIQEEEREFVFCGADGQGLMTPDFARKIARDLELDETPSVVIIRAPFLKGILCTFDMVDFSKKVAQRETFVDVYGDEVNINDVDVIVSESQFKLMSSYSSTVSYVESCKKNGLGFGVSRASSKDDKTTARSSYQFVQVLNLDDEGIKDLCEPTLEWIGRISGGDIGSALLYLLGELSFEKGWFDKLDHQSKALLLNNDLIKDSYFLDYIDKNISKAKSDAKLGRLIFHGNYSFMVADPYGQLSVIFGMPLTPLLNDKEHYCNFWNERGIQKVAAIRSPTIHSSEINILNLQDNENVNYWYKYLGKSCVVFPLNGVGLDFAIASGADVDGDLICTINNPAFINGKIEGLPIMYDAKKAAKVRIDDTADELLVQSQIKQVRANRIGFYTNVCSSLQSMMYDFPKDSEEYKTILNRLKYFRVEQGNAIDSTKGIRVDPFLTYWTDYTKITDEMSEEEKKKWEFNNRLVARKRPLFFIHLYNHYRKEYVREMSFFNNITMTKWGLNFEEMLHSDRKTLTDEQTALVDKYRKVSFFICNNSVMNRVSRYVENKLKEIQKAKRRMQEQFDYKCLLSRDYVQPLKRDIEKFRILYKEYKSLKRQLRSSYGKGEMSPYIDVNQIYSFINRKAFSTISSSGQELGDLAVFCTYSGIFGKQSKSFAWHVFGEQIVDNMLDKEEKKCVRVYLPMENGSIEYLWRKFSPYLLNIEE
jgi:hypothetical protein